MQPSIGRKLYYSLIASLTVLWLGVVVAVIWVVEHETEEIFNSSLQETAQRLLSLTMRDLQAHTSSNRLEISEPMEHDEYLTYQTFNTAGEMLMRSHGAPEQAYPVPLKVGYYEVNKQHFYVEASRDGRYIIQIAERTNHRDDTFFNLLRYLLLPLGALLPIAALVIYWSVKSAQKSIFLFGSDISTRGGKDLKPLNIENLPSEFLMLGESVNSLMHRLQLALEAERSFTANSAHELRTPIAAALAQLDVLRGEISHPANRARVAEARAMIEHLEQITVKLLQLAKAESGTGLNLKRIDIDSLTTMLLQDLSFRSTRQLRFTHPDQPVWIQGDVDAVGIAIQNLLENADRYASADTALEIEITPEGALTVRNDCEEISAAILQTLRNRFVRANQTKTGSGIGLSIVDMIIEQCEAELILQSPCYANQRGFAATVHFKPW